MSESYSRRSAFAMIGAMVSSGLLFFATQARWIAELIAFRVNSWSPLVGLGFGISLLNIGSGIIIGLRITASMLLGGLIAWIIGPMWLLDHGLITESSRRVDILLLVMWRAPSGACPPRPT